MRVITTSRVPLAVTGEQELALGPLPPPSDDVTGTSMQLAMERNGLTDSTISELLRKRLTRLCHATGGIPLLVEMYAASIELRDNFTTNADSYGDSISGAVDSALAELDDMSQRLAVTISPLPAGVTERTAAALLGESVDAARRQLRSLARVRLADTSLGLTSLRYRSLDPIREQLRSRTDPAQQALILTDATLALREQLDEVRPHLLSPTRVALLDGVEDEHDNVRFLLRHQLVNEPVAALRLAISASEFWPLRGHIVEGRQWLERCVHAAAPEGQLRWRAVLALTRTTRTFAEISTHLPALEQAVAEARGRKGEEILFGSLLIYVAMARGWTGERAAAVRAIEEARGIDRAHGSPWSSALIDHIQAFDLALSGDFQGAREAQRTFAKLMEEFDDPAGAATGYYLAATMGDWAGATDLRDDLTRARILAESHRDVALLGQILRVEARLLLRVGDPASREAFQRAADQLKTNGAPRAAALARLDLGLLDLEAGNLRNARSELYRSVSQLIDLDPDAARLGLAALAAIAKADGRAALAGLLASAGETIGRSDARSEIDRTRMAQFLDGIVPNAQPPDRDSFASALAELDDSSENLP